MFPDWNDPMKKSAVPLVLLALAGLAIGCAANRGTLANRDVLTQVSTYDALAAGLYDGVAPLSLFNGRGDLGLGTLHGWDGELLLLDGEYWLVDGEGAVRRITDRTATTPFLAVTFFDEDVRVPLKEGTTLEDLKKFPARYLPSRNVLYAARLEGTFRRIKVRSMPAQTKPYKPMAELVKTQPTFEFTEVRGTIVGTWTPASMQGIGLSGWHMHFLTQDRRGGGHVLEFATRDAVLRLDETLEVHWHIPGLPEYRDAPLPGKP